MPSMLDGAPVWMLAVLAVAGGASLASCKKKEPSADEVLAKELPRLEVKAAAIERVAKAPLPAATGKITLEGPPLKAIGIASSPPTGNATLLFDKDLEDLAWYSRVDLRTSDTMQLGNDCYMMARRKSMAGIHDAMYDRDPMWGDINAHDALRKIPACLSVRYLVVVRLDKYKKSEYLDKKTFAGGNVEADALVFDLETGKYAGGVAFKAESSDFTKAAHDADLASNFYKALQQALVAALPSATL